MKKIFWCLTLLFNIVQADKSVIDRENHLQWEDRVEISEKIDIWKMAKSHCESMEFAGFNDWRLPSKYELQSLAKSSKVKALFSNLGENLYWSIDEDMNDDLNAYVIYTSNGFTSTSDKCEKNYIVCVRDTK